MSKWIWTGLFKAIAEIIRKLFERRSLERARDEQERNRERDFGDADDVSAWLRDPSAKPRSSERDGGQAGGVPSPDDEGGTKPRR